MGLEGDSASEWRGRVLSSNTQHIFAVSLDTCGPSNDQWQKNERRAMSCMPGWPLGQNWLEDSLDSYPVSVSIPNIPGPVKLP